MTPMVNEESGFLDGFEPVLIETVIPEGSVEGFDEGILHGFAGLDVMKMDVGSLSPKVDGLAGKLGTVVGGDGFGQATSDCELFQDINDGSTANGGIDVESQTLTGKVVNQSKAAEPATGGELVMDEVHGPALIGALRLWQWHPGNGRQLLAVFTTQGESFLTVKTFGSLVIDDQPLGFEHIMEDRGAPSWFERRPVA